MSSLPSQNLQGKVLFFQNIPYISFLKLLDMDKARNENSSFQKLGVKFLYFSLVMLLFLGSSCQPKKATTYPYKAPRKPPKPCKCERKKGGISFRVNDGLNFDSTSLFFCSNPNAFILS